MGKNTLFRWPFGGVMRWLGGVSIDRSAPHGVVKQTVDIFASRPKLVLGITPEGTRSKVEHWKHGFYHIAKGSGLPIVPVYFDYPRRCIGFGTPLIPGEDFEADFERIVGFYRGHLGKRPENQTYL
jgi:1-acyl-sn-glycerol-3-phosphate acyltransferase